uniref:cadherin-related family member 3-like n=1 Tax=Centroberyx gerrardi TaxID=166262 RepID=UPI003AACD69A
MECEKFNFLWSLVILYTWLIQGLPGTASLAENSAAGSEVYCFQLVLSPGASLAPGYPTIINSDPLTTDFIVSMHNTTQAKVSVTGNAELDFETAPNRFVFQILAVDSEQDSALQTLTVILTDVDEAPNENGANATHSSCLFPSYSLNVSVSDGNNAVSKTLIVNIVNINDDKPQFINKITSFTIPEELSPGVIVANIRAVVPNAPPYDGFIFYTISTNNYLAIHRYTGLVTVANRMDCDSSPLRQNPTVTVTVTATFRPSGPPLANTIILDITVTDINDNPPICLPAAQRVAVLETEIVGSLITTVTCTDNDVDDNFRQFQFTGLSCLDCTLHFALNSSNRIVLKGSLDFEDPSNLLVGNEYRLLAVAEDKNDTSLKGSAYVYLTVTPVNEFPPVFSPSSYFYSISELLGRGAVIGAVNATDRDLPATPVHYSIISGVGSGGLSNIFFLDPKLGSIALLTRPDYETTQYYRLLIRAVDGDPVRPLSVTINITEANDEPPVCGPNRTNLIVPVDQRGGSNVQGFILSCTDKDSPPTSFIYSISGASNLNNHFVFSPLSGTNVTRLLLKERFDFESGLDRVWRYSLTVLISDGNLRAGEAGSRARAPTQTGTVIINIQVLDPSLTTVITTTTVSKPRVTYITLTENTFSLDDWYVWFVIALGAMLLLAVLAYLLYHCCRWLSTADCSCCQPRPVEEREELIPEPATPKEEIILEVTKINTVFDGEAVDPVTNRVYEYNSKSGARRWKDISIVSEYLPTQRRSSTLIVPENTDTSQQNSSSMQSLTGRVRTGTGLSQTRSEGEGRASGRSSQSPAVSVRGRKPETVPMTTIGTTSEV